MKPILFNTEMVQAILEGRKTVSRRKIDRDITNFCDVDTDGTLLDYQNNDGDFINPVNLCRYQVGDTLYVRETFRYVSIGEVTYEGECIWTEDVVQFKASQEEFRRKYGDYIGEYYEWKPSIHMPKDLARIFLKVTDVRVERLQDITWEQAEKEGVWHSSQEYREKVNIWRDSACALHKLRIEYFAKLWDSLNKKRGYGWEANPWVWIIEFERIM